MQNGEECRFEAGIGSVDSVGGASDISWEAVETSDANPTKWIPDHAVTHCMSCDTRFWTINRRHHCRSVRSCLPLLLTK